MPIAPRPSAETGGPAAPRARACNVLSFIGLDEARSWMCCPFCFGPGPGGRGARHRRMHRPAPDQRGRTSGTRTPVRLVCAAVGGEIALSRRRRRIDRESHAARSSMSAPRSLRGEGGPLAPDDAEEIELALRIRARSRAAHDDAQVGTLRDERVRADRDVAY